MPTYKIAVLGAGNIGGSIGRKWVEAGHQVAFGVSDPDGKHGAALKGEFGDKIMVGNIEQALATGPEVVLLAVPSVKVGEIIAHNAAQLDGKIIFDATNNFSAPVKNAFPVLQKQTPNALLFRAFNNLGWENFINSDYNGVQADAFYCGDESARDQAEQLINEVGVNPVYLGGPEKAEAVDAFLTIFIALAGEQKMGRLLAYKLLRRDSY